MGNGKLWALRVAVVILGFAVGRILFNYLESIGAVEIGFMSESRNLWLIPLTWLGTPLFALGLTTRVWKVTLVIGAVLSLIVLFVAWPRAHERRESEERYNQQQAVTRRAFMLAEESFRPMKPLHVRTISPSQCPGRGVRVTGENRTVWYWYDAEQDRITASVTDDQLRELINSWLPFGGRLKTLEPQAESPGVEFAWESAQGSGYGNASFVNGCGLALGWLNLGKPASLNLELAVPLGGPVPYELVGKQTVARLQWVARPVALAAFGGSGGAVAAPSDIRDPGCSKLVVRVSEGSRQVWYWVDGAAGKVLVTLTEEQVRSLLSPFLPTGVTLPALTPADRMPPNSSGPLDIVFHNPQDTTSKDQVTVELSDQCTFKIDTMTIGGHSIVVNKELTSDS